MMPIDFCASLEPCANAMNPADTSCSTRKLRLTVAGREDVRRSVPVLQRSVLVRVAPLYISGQFVQHNWQWIIATGATLGGGVVAWEKVFH